MLSLADILKPRYVDLALGTGDPATAIDLLARRWEGDASMLNWSAFHAALKLRGNAVGAESLLSHVRTDHVSTMLMAAGRMPAPATRGGTTPVEGEAAVRFVFLVAVPMTLASDYLRIVGALARSLRNPEVVAALAETTSEQDFINILSAEAVEL